MIKCIELNFREPAIYNLLGLILERLGKIDESIASFSNAIELIANNEFSNQILCAYENKARVLCCAKRFKESIECYELIIKHITNDPFIFAGYGMALFFDTRLMDSLISFEKALMLCNRLESSNTDTNTTDITLMLSKVLFALGTPDHLKLARQQLLQW